MLTHVSKMVPWIYASLSLNELIKFVDGDERYGYSSNHVDINQTIWIE